MTTVGEGYRVDVSRVLGPLMDITGVTEVALARRLWVTVSGVRAWAAGEATVHPNDLPDIAAVFGVTADQLVQGTALRILRERAARQRLHDAGMTEDRAAVPFELYCFMCGRGTGRGGVLVAVRTVPRVLPPCAHCHGVMFVRECVTGDLPRQSAEAAA